MTPDERRALLKRDLELGREEIGRKVRSGARDDLVKFVNAVAPDIVPAKFHLLLAEKLMAVARGEILRLLILMPPGHGKSSWASVWFPAWFIGLNPTAQVITASNTEDLAKKWSRRVRGLVASPEYGEIFETRLSAETQAAGEWETKQGGEYFAVGVEGALPGRRGHLAIIDDPFKSWKSAYSAEIRQSVWEWYVNDLHNRLQPKAPIVLMHTRWHEDDLAGRAIEDMEAGGERWDVLCLPAEAEENDLLGRAPGEFLWPEYFDRAHYETKKSMGGAHGWPALFQQHPTPPGGLFFEEAWIRWYEHKKPPAELHRYGASDYAVTADGGDYTVHGVIGVDPEDNIYVIDWWRKQTASDKWVETLLDLMKHHEPMAWAEEKDQIGKSLGPFITKRMRERRVSCLRREFSGKGDKPAKARSIQARMSEGRVYLPRGAPWVPDLLAELLRFPAGKHDDQVDVLSLFGRMLDRMVPARKPKPKPRDPLEVRPITFDELIKLQPKLDPEERPRI